MSEIKNRIITLFDFVYNNTNLDNYEIKNIKPDKIVLEHIKITDKKKSEELLEELKNGKFKLDKCKDGNFRFIRYDESFPVLVLISSYKNKKEMSDISSTINRDSFFSFLLSEKVLEKKFNFIELPIINFDIKCNDIIDLLKNYLDEDFIYKNKFSENFSVRIRERFFKSKTLLEHLKTDVCDVKDILYQISLCLEQIKYYYPNFKHNDLDLSKINVYYKKDKGVVKTYYVGKEKYEYISPGFELKIGNFEKSCLKPIIKDSKKNDLVILANNILKCKLLKKIKCDENSIKLIKKISSKSNSMNSIDPITPKEILKSVFKDSRILKKNSIDNKKLDNNHNYYLGKKSLKIKGKVSRDFGDCSKMKYNKLIRKYVNKNQKGGFYSKPKPRPRRTDANDPGISNDQRMSYKKHQMDKSRPREPDILAQQTVYQQQSAPPRKNPTLYPPAFIPTNNPTYNMTVPLNPWKYEINKMPIQNIYNISMADPRGDHSRLARVYEDITPGNEFGLSSININERIDSSNYIKRLMVKMKDGIDMSLSGGEGSLLEHIKLMEINPYYYTDPYTDLPNDKFLLYTSAYPIRYDSDRERIKLAKNSVGLNLRMYGLTNEEIRSHMGVGLDNNTNNHPPWQELNYYIKIDEIVKKKKETQNLVMMHFWVYDRDSRIKYDEIKKIKDRNLTLPKIIQNDLKEHENHKEVIDNLILKLKHNFISRNGDDNTFEKNIQMFREMIYNNKINDDHIDQYFKNQFGILKTRSKEAEADVKAEGEAKAKAEEGEGETGAVVAGAEVHDNYLDEKFYNLMKKQIRDAHISYLKKSEISLGIVTESPTHTFIQWASPKYEGNGALKTQIQTGFHNYKVYESILFQFMHGMYILQKNNIYYENFNVEYNLFIKDIYTDDRDRKHWLYVVDGVKYYVPNYGYIGLIDSFFQKKDNKVITIENNSQDDNKRINEATIKELKKQDFIKITDDKQGQTWEPLGSFNKILQVDADAESKSEDFQFTVKQYPDINERIFDNFKKIIDINFYNTTWLKNGANAIPDEFKELLIKIQNKIKENNSSKNIKDYFEFFAGLLNNRIGDKVTNTEMLNIDITKFSPKVNKGEMVAIKDDSGYRWGLVLEKTKLNKGEIVSKYKVKTDKNKEEELFCCQFYLSNAEIEPSNRDGIKYNSSNIISKIGN